MNATESIIYSIVTALNCDSVWILTFNAIGNIMTHMHRVTTRAPPWPTSEQ